MSESTGTESWRIPYGISFEKVSKVLRVLLQKKADTDYVSFDSLIPLTGLAKGWLSPNMSFFKSVGIVDGDNSQGYKFTELGKNYATAISLDKPEEIKKYTLEMIKNSHLNDLKVFVDTEGENIVKEQMFKLIKTKARIKDGDYAGNMPRQSSDGANTIVTLFNKADLIPEDLIATKLKRNSSSIKKTQKSSKHVNQPSSNSSQVGDGNFFSLNSSNFSLQIAKNIDLDELDFIKTQIDSLVNFAEKKLSDKTSDEVSSES